MSAPVRVRASDGCRIATWLDGPADAPVLMLSNSLGTTAAIWAPQLRALAARFRVLRYDSRGHGASDAPPGDYDIERLATDALDVLAARGVSRAHFCGLSLGGMVGQWLGAHAPERIGHLVLANTAPAMGPASSWQDRIRRVLEGGMRAIAAEVVERWFTPAFRDAAPAVVETATAMLEATPATGYAGCCAAIRDLDLGASAARITAPTLLIAGAADQATPPARAAAIAEAMPARPRVVTLDAAHLSSVEQPEAFTHAVLEFLP